MAKRVEDILYDDRFKNKKCHKINIIDELLKYYFSCFDPNMRSMLVMRK